MYHYFRGELHSPENINGHISTQTLLSALRSQGVPKGEFTNHGWRHAASTRHAEFTTRHNTLLNVPR